MSQFYDQSSLVFLPSGYKDGKLYSQKPLSTSGELSFSRGSDIEATRVGPNGYIEKAQVNLALHSEDATNAQYTKSNVSVTANSTTAPDGTTTADTITATANGATLQGVISVSAGSVYTMSVYLKRKTGTGQIGLRGVSNAVTNVTITSEWQRYEVYMAAADANGRYGVYLATSGDEVYAWGFQINYGTIAQTYVPTTTAAVVSGITNDMPRLNYDPANPTCPSLLLEPSRQNLFTQSELLSSSFWFDDDILREQNTSETLSPEGVYNAVKLTETATNARHRLASNTLTISNATYTASVFLKKGTARYGFVHLSGANAYTIVVDLEQGVITDTATNSTIAHQSVEDYGNGWYRCSVAGNMASVTTAYVVQFGTAGSATPSYNNYVPTFLGSTSNNIYAFGADMELGSYPTSYIPTYGSSATRTADACSKTGISSLIGQTEGTLFAEIVFNNIHPSDGGLMMRIAQASGSFSNAHYIDIDATGLVRGLTYNGGVQQSSIVSGTHTKGTRLKIAYAYKANDFALYINGVQIGTDTSGSVPSSLEFFMLGCYSPTKIAQVPMDSALLFSTRLPNSDLATLTSL